jgi:hypothetical protein
MAHRPVLLLVSLEAVIGELDFWDYLDRRTEAEKGAVLSEARHVPLRNRRLGRIEQQPGFISGGLSFRVGGQR